MSHIFSLKKWYLDVADENGNIYIGYRANLEWGALKFGGAHHLWRASGTGAGSKMCLGDRALPKFSKPDRLTWRPRGFAGTWATDAAAIEETLFDSPKGKIVWRCTQPKARARIESKEISFSGRGYTEVIDITVPVWELPFRTLYWGRCHTESNYLVWIKWEGATKKDVYWRGGKRGTGLSITESGISAKDFCLEFGEKIPLRQGVIASTVFGHVAALVDALPKTALHVDENKWYSRGTLKSGRKTEKATIIFEKVTW